MRILLYTVILFGAVSACAAAGAGDLRLLISIDQPVIATSVPAQITLHLHNSGKQTLFLYTPVRDAADTAHANNPFESADAGAGATSGGSALQVNLIPAASSGAGASGKGQVLEQAGFPQPKLIAIPPGEDFEEKAVIRLSPAAASPDEEKLFGGRYNLSVTYSAKYSNGDDLLRILGTDIWQGEAKSNILEVELHAPAAGDQGSISGSVLGADMQPTFGAIVTLSDQKENALAQSTPDENGKFTFTHLPFGFYWVTARRRNANENTTVFRHAEISAADPRASVQLVILQTEVHRTRELRHKPVLIRVFDPNNQPVGDVSLDATWSNGTLMVNIKGRTGSDGTVLLRLIPGRNFLSLRRSGCPKDDERIDVQPGGGIDGFNLVFPCAKR